MRFWRPWPSQKGSGFTLVETLLAMTLLAGAVIVLGNASIGASNALRKSRSLTTLSLLLQRKITEYEIRFRDKTKSGPLPEKEEGEFEGYEAYTWRMESKQIEVPDMSAALTARDGGATDTEIMIVRQLTDLIQNSVKEVRVTVIWKTGVKDMEYSVTTYLVDHDQAKLPGLPGGGGTGGNAGGSTPGAPNNQTPGSPSGSGGGQ